MKKISILFLMVPLFLVGCGKNKDVYAKSKNTIYKFELNGDNAIITGFSDKYKNQSNIIIPYSIDKHVVTEIAEKAFYRDYHLKTVDMSKSNVTKIGDEVFEKCNELNNVIFPTTIDEIGTKAFAECDKLEKIDLSVYNITTISDNLFEKCITLSDVKLPNVATTLGSNVFLGCDELETLDLSNTSITTINDYAISGLKELSQITLPDTLTTLGSYSLSDNKNVKYIDLAKTGLTEIKEGAFSNCSLLANVTIPKTLSTLGKKAFYYCSSLEKMELSKTNVTEIPESCFELCLKLGQIKLSKVEKIGSRAFYNNIALKEINIPKETTSIADDAFRLCKSMTAFTVDENNNSYTDRNGVLYTADLKTLLVYPSQGTSTTFECPAETTKINSYAFSDNEKLLIVDLTQPLNLSEIAEYTFMNCTSLQEVRIFDNAEYSIKKIGTKAFFKCKALTKFDAKVSITEIGESAFFDCIGLTEVNLGNSPIQTIGSEAFYNCNKLETLTLPGTLNSIGRAAFYGCFTDPELPYTISYGNNETKLRQLLEASPDCGLEGKEITYSHS